MTPSPREVLEHYFAALTQRDTAAIAALYSDTARFHDPVFPVLNADEVRGMWRMLLRAPDLQINAWVDRADNLAAEGRWEAHYDFGPSRRRVVNRIRTRIEVEQGCIQVQVDQFDFWRWSRMALGPLGWALGWTGWLRERVQRQARARLDRFLAGSA